MTDDSSQTELDALNTAMGALQRVDEDARARIVSALIAFFRISTLSTKHSSGNLDGDLPSRAPHHPPFSDNLTIAPKEFMRIKQPKSDVERIACLAYYLTHYRDSPHFKTLELTKLNTEAAQPKFANAAKSAGNALQYGYLAAASRGQRQLSAAGEEFVNALPDRDAARKAMVTARPKRKQKRVERKDQ